MFGIPNQAVFQITLIAGGVIVALAVLAMILRARSRPRPVLAYRNIPELSKLTDANREISVTYAGRQVDRVTRMRIWFWNAGRKPLMSGDILPSGPMTITFRGPGLNPATVLDFQTLKTAGPDVGFVLARDGSPSALQLNFTRLGPGCGALFEVQHDGAAQCRPELGGLTVGAGKSVQSFPIPADIAKRPRPLPLVGTVARFFGRGGGLALLIAFSFQVSLLLAWQLDKLIPPDNPGLEVQVAELLAANGIESAVARRAAHNAVAMAVDNGAPSALYVLSLSPMFLALGFYAWLRKKTCLPRALRLKEKPAPRSWRPRRPIPRGPV